MSKINKRDFFISNVAGANFVTDNSSLLTSLTNRAFKTGLTVGDIYVTNSNYDNIITSAELNEGIFIVEKQSSVLFKQSPPIGFRNITSIKREDYDPKVEMVKSVGFTTGVTGAAVGLPSTFGITYTLPIFIIGDYKLGTARQIKENYIFTSSVSPTLTGANLDTARASFFQQFVDKINNDPKMNSFVTAALVNDAGAAGSVQYGIQITADAQLYQLGYPYNTVNFEIGYSAYDFSYTYSNTATQLGSNTVTRAKVGIGTYESLSYQEWLVQSDYKGLANFTEFPFNTISVDSIPGVNYDIFSITYNTGNKSTYGVAMSDTSTMIIACVTGSTKAIAVRTQLGVLATALGLPAIVTNN